MATTRISTLRPGGSGTNIYSSLSAWRSSLPASLVSADTVEILEVEAESGGWSIGTGVSFSGVTTDATRYIEIRAAAGHRHSGVWDTTKALFKGTPSSGGNGLINAGGSHTVRVIGMQLEVIDGPSSATCVVLWSGSGGKTIVDGCLFQADAADAASSGSCCWVATSGTGIVANCSFIRSRPTGTPGSFDPFRGINHTAGALVSYNNTFYECGKGIHSDNNGTVSIRNCLVACKQVNASYVDVGLSGASTTNCSYNATSDTTAPGSTGARTSQTFTFKGAPTNLKLSSTDAGAKGFGTDLSADGTYAVGADCGGQSRSGTWDIGADQLDPSSTIALSAPATNRIHQHAANVATIAVSGSYTGTPATIQARVVNNGTSSPVTGLDWFTAVASPSGGAFSFNIANVPKALQWYQIQVRFSDDTAVNATSGKVAVGELIAMVGQSNAVFFFDAPAVASPSDYGSTFGNGITGWVSPAAGTGSGNLINDLVTLLGCPVGVLSAAVGGTSINTWTPGQGEHTQAMTVINNAGGKLCAMAWVQGEADWDGMTGATYTTKLGQVFDGSGFRSELSQATLPVVIVGNGRWSGGSASTYDQIKAAQKAYALAASTQSWVERADLHPSGELHLSSTNHGVMGRRIARAVAWHKGAVSTYRGPRVRKINRISSTVYRVELTHDMGTDITPSTGITGWTCRDPGAGGAAITISSVARFSANFITITLAAAPVATHPQFSCLSGVLCDVSAPAKDNGGLTLPVEYLIDQASRTLASSVTITLEDGAGAPAASQTSLKWAFFDQATPDLFVAPVAKGASESTDGSGVLVVDITGTDLDAGSNGYLVITDSDGTTTQSPPAKRFAGVVQVA